MSHIHTSLFFFSDLFPPPPFSLFLSFSLFSFLLFLSISSFLSIYFSHSYLLSLYISLTLSFVLALHLFFSCIYFSIVPSHFLSFILSAFPFIPCSYSFHIVYLFFVFSSLHFFSSFISLFPLSLSHSLNLIYPFLICVFSHAYSLFRSLFLPIAYPFSLPSYLLTLTCSHERRRRISLLAPSQTPEPTEVCCHGYAAPQEVQWNCD